MRSTEKGRYEMLWDCPGCGTEKLLGLTHRHCPGCGAPQDPARRYFPPEGEEVAVDDHPYQGADVTCGACDTPNAAKASFCVGCGSPLDGARTVATRATQVAGTGGFEADSAGKGATEAEAARRAAREEAKTAHAVASGHAPPPRGGKGLLGGLAGVGCAGLVLLVVAAVAAFFLWKKDAALVVTGHGWERTVAVETYTAVRDSAWRDAVPPGAYDLACAREQRGTQKVEDGETCTDKRQDKGDGTFVVVQDCTKTYRDEPTYDDKCRYAVDRWQVTDTRRAAGTALAPAPEWPAAALARPGTCLGCQREGARKETYSVLLRDGAAGTEHRCDLPAATWSAMAVGSRWKAKVGVVSGALECDALVAAGR